MVFDAKGEIQHGLTGGYGRDRRVEYIIPREIVKAGRGEFWLEASCNAMFGQATLADPNPNNVGQDILDTAADEDRYYKLDCADLVAIDIEADKLFSDFVTLQQLATALPDDTSLANRATWLANEIIDTFRPEVRGLVDRCRRMAERLLGEQWEEKLQQEGVTMGRTGRVWPLGHW
jgi:alpha-mannosidase